MQWILQDIPLGRNIQTIRMEKEMTQTQVVEQLQQLIADNGLKEKVDLGGTFCMGKCQQGVCVTVDDQFYSVSPVLFSKRFKIA